MVKITRTADAFRDEIKTEGVRFVLDTGSRFNCIMFSENKKLIIKLSKLTGKRVYMKINGGVKNVCI